MKNERMFITHQTLSLIVNEMIKINTDPNKDRCSQSLLDLAKGVLRENNRLAELRLAVKHIEK